MNPESPQGHSLVDQVTRILRDAEKGKSLASSALLPLVYDELRKLAGHRMNAERTDHTLQPTALVHEAYVRLVGDNDIHWANRAHFFSAAAEAMRRILIEHARAKGGPRRGGGQGRVPLEIVDVIDLASSDDPDQILALEDAMSRFEKQDPEAAKIVRLRFYAGLTVEETAKALGISPRTVKREWAFARVFLFRQLQGREDQPQER
jgi:RNA polymerase sigma factor (TIGR02999 family)